MEFPHVGKQCYFAECRQLDFLPHKCRLCHHEYCDAHYAIDAHNCEEKYKIDNRVPVCPICDQPVPARAGEDPNVAMDRHISSGLCGSPVQTRRNGGVGGGFMANNSKEAYTNACSFSLGNCRRKEAVKFICPKCKLNYCTRHRMERAHECKGVIMPRQSSQSQGGRGASSYSQMNSMGAQLAAERARRGGQGQNQGNHSQHGEGLSEEEQLQIALALSEAESKNKTTGESKNPEKSCTIS
eukprot:Nk52_evm15s1178 gene=Nk52_evmTU15s1178